MYKPENFNKVESYMDFMDTCDKVEYEEHLCWRLNKHIELNKPFDEPVGGKHIHSGMVDKGFLKYAGPNPSDYIFTDKSLGLLWSKFGIK